MDPFRKSPFAAKLLIAMHIFLGIGALYGGGAFIIDPSGKLIGMPQFYLSKNSPLNNFLVPGMILFVILGLMPLIVAYGLFTKRELKPAEVLNIFPEMRLQWTYSLYIGFALIIWIAVQAFIIGVMATIHLTYLLFGVTIQVVTLMPSVQKYYQKKQA